jgi:hypothetical protein
MKIIITHRRRRRECLCSCWQRRENEKNLSVCNVIEHKNGWKIIMLCIEFFFYFSSYSNTREFYFFFLLVVMMKSQRQKNIIFRDSLFYSSFFGAPPSYPTSTFRLAAFSKEEARAEFLCFFHNFIKM